MELILLIGALIVAWLLFTGLVNILKTTAKTALTVALVFIKNIAVSGKLSGFSPERKATRRIYSPWSLPDDRLTSISGCYVVSPLQGICLEP